MIDYLCQHCLTMSTTKIDSLTSGSVLTCEHCGGETVVTLSTHKIRAAAFATYEVCRELAKPPYADSNIGSLFETLRRRAQVVLGIEED